MTFNNWKSLNIGGNKLKRLVRVSDGLVLFEKQQEEYEKMPLCIEVTKMGTAQYAYVGFEFTGTDWTKPEFEYSFDNITWTKYSSSSSLRLTSLKPKVYLRATAAGNASLAVSTANYTSISIVSNDSTSEKGCRVKVYGNIMSLYTQDFLNVS